MFQVGNKNLASPGFGWTPNHEKKRPPTASDTAAEWDKAFSGKAMDIVTDTFGEDGTWDEWKGNYDDAKELYKQAKALYESGNDAGVLSHAAQKALFGKVPKFDLSKAHKALVDAAVEIAEINEKLRQTTHQKCDEFMQSETNLKKQKDSGLLGDTLQERDARANQAFKKSGSFLFMRTIKTLPQAVREYVVLLHDEYDKGTKNQAALAPIVDLVANVNNFVKHMEAVTMRWRIDNEIEAKNSCVANMGAFAMIYDRFTEVVGNWVGQNPGYMKVKGSGSINMNVREVADNFANLLTVSCGGIMGCFGINLADIVAGSESIPPHLSQIKPRLDYCEIAHC